jgi:hypothetical protein
MLTSSIMGTRQAASALSANETIDWVQTHAALSRLAHERAALDAEEGRWLLYAWRSAAHVHLGHGSFVPRAAPRTKCRPISTCRAGAMPASAAT